MGCQLEGMACYDALLLAPVDGFCPLGKDKYFLRLLALFDHLYSYVVNPVTLREIFEIQRGWFERYKQIVVKAQSCVYYRLKFDLPKILFS